MTSTPRTLQVDGLVNARDLGGLRRHDGSRTPSKVFYRSENVDAVTEAGWEQLRTEGIRTIVDLRQPRERARDHGRRPTWLTTRTVDLDGLSNRQFWADYWDSGLVATALYYLPHLAAMPERTVAAVSAIVTAPAGGVLFHCLSGRDRTGMISMILLVAIGTAPEEIVADYMETVHRGDARDASERHMNDEAERDALCVRHGTTTEGAFRGALRGLDLPTVLERGGIGADQRRLLMTWRNCLV